MAIDRQGTGLVIIRVCLGVFFIFSAYGKLRGNSEAIVKYTYDKIYNAQAFSACSNMPRFGHNGILKPEQIADLVGLLLDPQSPVNK